MPARRAPAPWWLAGALALLAGAARADGAAAPWLSAELGLADLGAVPARLQQPFDTPLPVRLSAAAGGQRVLLRHCADWLAQRDQAVGSDNDAAWRVVRHQVVVCDALARLAAARPAPNAALPAAPPDAADTRRWPATLWVAPSRDAAERLQQPGRTLASASGVKRWATGADGTRVLATRAWRVQLTELARVDVDGDGWQDWLLRWEAQSQQGSWTDARLVVLTRRAATEPLRELPPRP
ncbi:MAG: hypothetical protein U1F56_10595 [Rubrivivax sp.]